MFYGHFCAQGRLNGPNDLHCPLCIVAGWYGMGSRPRARFRSEYLIWTLLFTRSHENPQFPKENSLIFRLPPDKIITKPLNCYQAIEFIRKYVMINVIKWFGKIIKHSQKKNELILLLLTSAQCFIKWIVKILKQNPY